jgi:hypothetical protein
MPLGYAHAQTTDDSLRIYAVDIVQTRNRGLAAASNRIEALLFARGGLCARADQHPHQPPRRRPVEVSR